VYLSFGAFLSLKLLTADLAVLIGMFTRETAVEEEGEGEGRGREMFST